jgi:site-specific DNA recombinase
MGMMLRRCGSPGNFAEISMKKNVIELIRVSTEEQAAEDRAGIPAQREINRRTARAYDLNIIKTIEVVDVSGSSVLLSPEVQELLRVIECPDIVGVVAKEFSRLIRPEKFTDYALLQHFIDTNTILYLPDGPIDLASKLGRFFGTIRAAIAGLERREIVERMQDAKESMRRAGKHPGSSITLPYGVGYSKEGGWYYTAEAEKVKRTFALFLSGQRSYTEISKLLNLPRTDIRFILSNPVYTGWRIYDQKRDPSAAGYRPRPDGRQGDRRKIKRDPDEVIRVKVLEPLVSEEEFARVSQLIELKRRKHWRVRAETPARYTYNGFLICGDCRSLLYTHTSKHDFYICKSRNTRERRKRALVSLEPCSNRYMLRRVLEPKIDEVLSRQLTDRRFIARIVDSYTSAQRGGQVSDPVGDSLVEARVRALEEKKQRVLETFLDGLIGREDRDRRLQDLDREIASYHALRSSSHSSSRSPRLDPDLVAAAVEPFVQWEFLNREDRRQLLAQLCPEIEVYRYQVRGLQLHLADRHEDSRAKKVR